MKKVLFLFLALLLLFVCALCVCAAPADRPYQEDETTRIVDGVVYKENSLSVWSADGKILKANDPSWTVVDYFATDEIAKTATAIHIAPEIDGKPVTGIERHAGDLYKEGTYLNVTEITLPNTLRWLGDSCFSALDGVKKLVIPVSVHNGVDNIETGASPFHGMDGLEKIIFRCPLNTIYNYWFSGCTSLKKVLWKGELTYIGQEAFYGCKNLRSFIVPETVKMLAPGAFAYSGLVTVKIPTDLQYLSTDTSISGFTFACCEQLKKVTFTGAGPKNMEIPDGMFAYCSSLVSVTIPDEVKRVDVGFDAFRGCKALKKLSFDRRIFRMSDDAFRGCSSLQSFTVGKQRSYHMTNGKHEVVKMTRLIAPTAFKGCTALKKLRVLTTDPSFLWKDHRFIYNLPKNCKIYVRTANMKQAFLDKGCTNKVIVKRDLA